MNLHEMLEYPSISFRYGGRESGDFLDGWKRDKQDHGAIMRVTYADPATGLEVRGHLRKLDGFDAVDWLVELENRGSEDTPVMEDILPLDVRVPISGVEEGEENVYLHHAKGSSCDMDDFIPRTTQLRPGSKTELAPKGGLSSNGTLPFMNLQRKGGGTVLAIGWSGQWKAEFQRDKEHPEFLLKREGHPDNLLYNMGMPEAREYLTGLISNCITEHGVDIYRQDFNFDPLPYWEQADEPDRVGMTEIRYIEGFYRFWDELRERHPNIWIDNCSGGGRRIDLETMSRSLPLWPSDFPDACSIQYGMGLHVGDQCINAGLSRWIPFFGGGVWNFTPYGTRGEIVGGFTYGVHIDHKDFAPDAPAIRLGYKEVAAHGKTPLDDDFPIEDVRAAIGEWRSIREFFTGDFHLLLPLTVSYHDWCAWQFHRDDLKAGIATFFGTIQQEIHGKAILWVSQGHRKTFSWRLMSTRPPGAASWLLRPAAGRLGSCCYGAA